MTYHALALARAMSCGGISAETQSIGVIESTHFAQWYRRDKALEEQRIFIF